MNKTLSVFISILASCILKANAQDIEPKLQLSLSSGYQQENFHWSIAGNSDGQNPNVYSELKWKNISGTDYNTSLQYNVWNKVMLYGSYNRVSVRSGSVSDIDYSGDNRTDAVYNENFSDNKGNTSAWCVGAGYRLFNNSRFSLTPYIGYAGNIQNLYIVDETGQFPTLNSSYRANWKGGFLKVISSVKLWRSFKASVDVTYNQTSYNSQGDWNLIDEFKHPVSYRQLADGYGINTGAQLSYNIISQLSIFAGLDYFNWETGNGTDTLYLATGEDDKTQFNAAFRNGYQVSAGLQLDL
ncbi:hypothetical protein [Mucilaginibacter sp.]